jgi:hypothetical protein
LTVTHRRSLSSCLTTTMDRTNTQINPRVSNVIRVTPAPSGSEPELGDTAG